MYSENSFHHEKRFVHVEPLLSTEEGLRKPDIIAINDLACFLTIVKKWRSLQLLEGKLISKLI